MTTFLDLVRKTAQEKKERLIQKGGKGSGWYGPPKGTHGKGAKAKGKTIAGYPRAELERMNRKELESLGFIPVFRGTNAQGLKEIRPSASGVSGPGVYFYDTAANARSYAETGGGIVTGFLHPDDAKIDSVPGSMFSRPHKVIVLKDPDKFIRRGDIPTSETTGGYDKVNKLGEAALDKKRRG